MPVPKVHESKGKISVTISVHVSETPYKQIRESRRERKGRIKDFLRYIEGIGFFPMYIKMFSPLQIVLNKLQIAGLYFGKKSSLSLDDLLFIIMCNEVMSPTMELCINEFMVFLSELQVAGYNGAARTLRCVLETAVEACEFQTERNRPTFEILLKEHSSLSNLPEKERKSHSLLAKHNAWASFIERYRIYEKTKRIAPSFKEMVNNLNSRQIFQEAPKVSDELKGTYESLSDYVHPSLAKFEKATEKTYRPLFLGFDPKEFDAIYELGIVTFDLVQFLYLKSMAFFFDYKTTNEFLKELAKRLILKSKEDVTFLMLPHSKQVSEGIDWRIDKKNKSQKVTHAPRAL